MKEYINDFIVKKDYIRISVRTSTKNNTRPVYLSIDCGCGGLGISLTNEDVDKVIQMLKDAKECVNKGE